MKKLFGFATLAVLFVAGPAFAEEAAAAATAGANQGYLAIAAALAMGVAALGGTLGQGRAIASAMDGIARNPASRQQLFIPMILGLALMEALVILAFVIALMLVTKI